MSTVSLQVRSLSPQEHRDFVESRTDVSLLQRPEWALVKAGWRGESIGWFDGSTLVGAALVLHRALPVIRRTLAYVPDGPVIDFSVYGVEVVTSGLIKHLRAGGAFAVRIGPGVEWRTWSAPDVRRELGREGMQVLDELDPVRINAAGVELSRALAASGWTKIDNGTDFGIGQPEYVARVPLQDADGAPLTMDQVMSRFSSTGRRQTRRGLESDLTIEVTDGSQLHRFYSLYATTAERNEFSGRPAAYFDNLFARLSAADPSSVRLFLASHEGVDLAAAIWVRSGNLAWYLYGASTNEQRQLQAPKVLMHHMIEAASQAGCVYLEQGGVSSTLDGDHDLSGLTHFKATMGCDITQTIGEWTYQINAPLSWAFEKYLELRQRRTAHS